MIKSVFDRCGYSIFLSNDQCETLLLVIQVVASNKVKANVTFVLFVDKRKEKNQ